MIKGFSIVILLMLMSCGSAVITDYDSGTDFSAYKTYDFYPDIESGLNRLDEDRVKRSLDSLLPEYGLVRSTLPDLLLNFYVHEQLIPSRSSIGIGIGGGGRNVGVGVSGGVPIGGNKIEQRLTFDFIDRSMDRLIWQAVIESTLPERATTEQKGRHYFDVTSKILKEYPWPHTKR